VEVEPPEEASGRAAELLLGLFDVAELFEYGALLLFEPAVQSRAPHAPTDNATASATGAALKIRAAAFVFITILLRTGICATVASQKSLVE
jgi:hypothetical protein